MKRPGMEIKYSDVIKSRSTSLPRREYLEECIRNSRKRLLEMEITYKKNKKEEKQNLIKLLHQQRCYSLSTNVLKKYSHIQEFIENESGVYMITFNKIPIYVGESESARVRCFTHLKNITRSTQSNITMYNHLASVNIELISFQFLEKVNNNAAQRRIVEGVWCNKFINEGYKLYNRAWKGQDGVVRIVNCDYPNIIG